MTTVFGSSGTVIVTALTSVLPIMINKREVCGVVTRHGFSRSAGRRSILEYWIPAEDLELLNGNVVGKIEIVAEYRS